MNPAALRSETSTIMKHGHVRRLTGAALFCIASLPCLAQSPCTTVFPQRNPETSVRVLSEIEYDTRYGRLRIDGGNPLPPSDCWAPVYFTTNRVITVKIISRFGTSASVTPAYTQLLESLDVGGLGLAAESQLPNNINLFSDTVRDFMSRQPPVPATPPATQLSELLQTTVGKILCALDPGKARGCNPDAAAQLITTAQQLTSQTDPVYLRSNGWYQNQFEFHRLSDLTQKLIAAINRLNLVQCSTKVGDCRDSLVDQISAVQGVAGSLTPEQAAGLARAKDLQQQIDQMYEAMAALFANMNDWREKSEQTSITVLNQSASNQIVRLQFVVHDAYVPFSFAPAQPASGEKLTSAAKVSTATTNTTEQHVVREILLEVHHMVRFNAVGGFFWSTLRQRSFAVSPGPVYCTVSMVATSTTGNSPCPSSSGTPTTPGNAVGTPSIPVGTAVETQNSHQVGGLAAVDWYVSGKRDLFPGALTPAMRWSPGLLFGVSPAATPSFMLGLDFEPVTGIDLYLGGHYAQITGLASGVNSSTQLPMGGTVPTATPYRCCGLFVGVGLDFHIFSSIFSGLLGNGGPGSANTQAANPTAPAGGKPGH
jgi:hypothetical protein